MTISLYLRKTTTTTLRTYIQLRDASSFLTAHSTLTHETIITVFFASSTAFAKQIQEHPTAAQNPSRLSLTFAFQNLLTFEVDATTP